MVFFKTTNGVLKDAKVRQALVQAADVSAIINKLGYATTPVREPVLVNQLGYDPAYAQITNQPAKARALLDADGWKLGADGQRSKHGVPLAFDLFATSNTEYAHVTEELHKQWAAIGVNARIHLQQPDDFQNTLSSHSYDAVL
jgi:peptide/nickel transport system substrate-binding protein